MIRRKRVWALCLAAATCLASVVVVGADKAHQAPRVRLHGGAAWLASSKVGQLTLLDGSSAEVAAKVSVAAPGTPIRSSQLGPTGYALNLLDNTVVRVDGATLEPSQPSKLLGSSLFPTPQTLYLLNSERGLLTPLDPGTLSPQGTPYSLASKADEAIVDGEGRLWVLDQKTGDLSWFAAGTKHSLEGTGPARIAVTDGHPVLLHLSRRQLSLLDPSTGSALETIRADIRPDDTVSVTGSAGERRILISIASRGLLMVCNFASSCSEPVPLGSGKADLGAAVEVGNHAIIPDYSTGRVWIVNLATNRVVERQLFNRPVQFELLTRDGLVFYNDPDSDQAGVLTLDGNVRAVSKYNPTKPDAGPNQVAMESPNTARQSPPTNRSGPADAVPPVKGPGRSEPAPPPPPVGAPMADIVIKPRNHGLVGDEFELEVVARSPIGIATARWTFGDGTEATGLAVKHRWNRPGEFRVEVAPMLAIGLPARVTTATVTIEPADTPPRIASINVDPATPQAGEAVRFSARVTGRGPDRWEWNVQGSRGTVATSRQREFRHTFATPGRYTVTLAVQAGNVRVQQFRQITVVPEPPPVRCGDVLTASAVLKSDLVCPNDVALTIAANNVTLDLRGHTLTTDRATDTSVGIKVGGPRPIQNTTIKNGLISQFHSGISMTDVNGVTISGIIATSTAVSNGTEPSGADITGISARDVLISDATLNGLVGFVVSQGSSLNITDSTLGITGTGNWWSLCRTGSSCTVTNGDIAPGYIHCSHDFSTSNSSITIRASRMEGGSAGDIGCASATLVDNQTAAGRVAAQTVNFIRNNVSNLNHRSVCCLTINSRETFLIKGNTFTHLDNLTVEEGTGVVSENNFIDNDAQGLMLTNYEEKSGHVEIFNNFFARNGIANANEPWSGGLIGIWGRPATLYNNQFNEHGEGKPVDITRETTVDGGGNIVDGREVCLGKNCN